MCAFNGKDMMINDKYCQLVLPRLCKFLFFLACETFTVEIVEGGISII